MFFFCVKDLLLNIISNITPIYGYKYSILLKEVSKILNNINIAKCLSVNGLSHKILPEIFPQCWISVVSPLVKQDMV